MEISHALKWVGNDGIITFESFIYPKLDWWQNPTKWGSAGGSQNLTSCPKSCVLSASTGLNHSEQTCWKEYSRRYHKGNGLFPEIGEPRLLYKSFFPSLWGNLACWIRCLYWSTTPVWRLEKCLNGSSIHWKHWKQQKTTVKCCTRLPKPYEKTAPAPVSRAAPAVPVLNAAAGIPHSFQFNNCEHFYDPHPSVT